VAIDFTYRYAFLSQVKPGRAGTLRFASAICNADHAQPYLFQGRLRQPRMTFEMLHVLSDIVRTHLFLPRPALLDPVLTFDVAERGGFHVLEVLVEARAITRQSLAEPAQAALRNIRGSGTAAKLAKDLLRAI
jgi:hypothetical protein